MPRPWSSLRVARPWLAFVSAVLVLGAVVVTGAAPPASARTAPRFAAAVRLPRGQGAEPSITIDTTHRRSRGYVYVGAIGDRNGPLEWRSYNHGRTFARPVPFDLNGPARGEDE